MLWEVKRTISIRGSFEDPKHMFELKVKNMIITLCSKVFYLDLCFNFDRNSFHYLLYEHKLTVTFLNTSLQLQF